ncbi:MAG: histidine triad nucleotide-binding protein [Burkholderiales bacterium]|nr:histidine triad nucleotide-binding protein [Burkholderiales bacterium]
MADSCIFCGIVTGAVPSRKIYEDDEVLALHDIHPLAAVHFMVIPKEHVPSMAELTDSHQKLMGKIMTLVPRLAKEQGCDGGFRTIVNTGKHARQDIHHLHVHVIGGELLPGMIVRQA